ncbi:MAG: glycosyltransferase family 2 protein, partial [Bdellovibrionales bacterium]|nr:glycosyltransferase family 2 protein [Bdellovibrionales bacterium]
MKKVLAHIVVFEDFPHLQYCLHSLRAGRGDFELALEVTENGPSKSGNVDLQALCDQFGATLYRNDGNLGFSGAHNQAATRFLASDYDYFLIVNPDLALRENALSVLLQTIEPAASAIICPLLIRADDKLVPVQPQIIDSAGMEFVSSLRHFDRYAGRQLKDVSLSVGPVPGGSGACLLFSRKSVHMLVLPRDSSPLALFDVFPQLAEGYREREQLFDESFFAYREDAELSLRARKFGVLICFQPEAVGFHVRRVTPERRSALSEDINRHSVRNRFLLQLLHWSPKEQPETILPGFILRNLVVILGVLFFERTSMRGLVEAVKLTPFAWRGRKRMQRIAKSYSSNMNAEDPIEQASL